MFCSICEYVIQTIAGYTCAGNSCSLEFDILLDFDLQIFKNVKLEIIMPYMSRDTSVL